MRVDEVREIQGLYGPFTLTERVVQKIWLRQDFATHGLKTVAGQALVVQDPGRWNLLGGPDFKEARLLLDGQPLVGDVEVHFSPSDWYAHQHERNPEFNQVVLHVVLHPETSPTLVKTQSGRVPELLVLLPLLERDLEAYATDEALLEMERVDDLEWVARFLERPLPQRLEIVQELSYARWEQKVRFAAKRLQSADWSEACHQLCMEVLGYSRNRAAMARIALNHPLSSLVAKPMEASALYATEQGHWKLSGLRPANHPRLRLEQALQLLRHDPKWPESLKRVLGGIAPASPTMTTSEVRRCFTFPERSDHLRMTLFDGIIGEKRFHTMMVDAFLPLGTAAGLMDGYPYWQHWWSGDCPDALRRFLKHAELTTKQQPVTNGLVQGALALFLNRGI